ncbi:MAG TPA: homocysteine S-methyltransferase family protein [Burkholderiales bacterium]|nr:homocysteine S-methyltransferase family protein [Burkholderiales bacterium]
MRKYQKALPQLGDRLFMTDGGLETTLIYHGGFELPSFAAFDLLRSPGGTEALRDYFEGYARMARRYELGLVLESPTWRANPDWASRIGYDAALLAAANASSIDMLQEIRDTYETPTTPIVISGNIGPRGDGYVADRRMTARQAYDYHAPQVETFAASDADMVAAFTMNYVEEAIGVVKAAQAHATPVAISFTLETDGRLPSGETLEHAIMKTDAETALYAAYYMINCAHPTHFAHVLADNPPWSCRIRGLRANASTRSHAELDASTDLDAGDPEKLAIQYRALAEVLPALNVVGGCCGTDDRHVDRICSVLIASQGFGDSSTVVGTASPRARRSMFT